MDQNKSPQKPSQQLRAQQHLQSPPQSKTQQFLTKQLKEYYTNNKIPAPKEVEKREFGWGGFGQKISTRHFEFKSESDFNNFLRTQIPFYISCSNALYQKPSARPMAAKLYQRADIVYEFDSNDLKCECTQKHDFWKCPNCGKEGKGIPEHCDECGAGVSVENWVCPSCLDEVKKEVFRLLEFLENDFAITEGIEINFSGNRGYHIHLTSEQIQALPKEGRTSLLDYLTAQNLNPKLLGYYMDKTSRTMRSPPKKQALGWANRINASLHTLIENTSPSDIAAITGARVKDAEVIKQNKDSLEEAMQNGILPPLPKTTEKFWLSLINRAIQKTKLTLDRQASLDLSKIMRVPNTIHGSTCLAAKTLSIENLKDYNPLKESVVLGSAPIKIQIRRAPKITLADQEFGPFNEETAEIPAFAAAYFLAKGVAELQ